LEYADVTPLNRVWWRTRIGYYAYHIGDYPAALRALNEAEAILHTHGLAGLQPVEPVLAYFKALVALASRDAMAARECAATLHRLATPQRSFHMWYLQFLESVLALLDGNLAASVGFARACIRTAEDMGMIYVQELGLTLTAHVLAQMGRYDEALATTSQAKALVQGSVLDNMAAELLFVEASIATRRGESSKALALVRAAFETSRQTGYAFWFRFMPDVLPQACELALSADIHTADVTAAVKRYGIPAPRPYVKHWPWPLQIATLGPFAVVKAGVPMDGARGGTRKPMELLQAIIALGVENVPIAGLIDHLWPDSEGDAGQKAFAITVHRLRKQLGDERVVVVKAGKVGVDPKMCWVDASAFERLAREASTLSDPAGAVRAATDLKALYRGRFLQADASQPWVLNPRQRLHARFLATVSKLGKALEDYGEVEAALTLYQHAIDVDPCAEPVYRRLMACHSRAGREQDAVQLYRLCCDSLKAAGIAGPASETDSLYRDLLSRNPA
jgi:DNA-binding SARP family transcriptional activator